MQPIFTDEQLKNMSRENLAQALKLMQEHQTKLEAKQKILEEKVHELEFLNALLSDKLTLARKKQFGSSSEKRKTRADSASVNSFKKKSSCPLDCPLLRYHICIHGLPQGSMALGKSCDLTHDQNMSKYISWWRNYHSNVCRGILKRSYSTVYLNRLVPV